MDKVHIVVGVPFFTKENLDRIAAADPRVELTDAMAEIWTEAGMTERLPLVNPQGTRMSREEASRRLDEMLTDTQAILGLRVPLNVVARAPRLRWVQTVGVGINHLGESVLNSDIMVTNATGINSASVAEYALYLMMMLAKCGPRLLENMEARRWERLPTLELEGRTLGLVGLGHIGTRLAGFGRTLGMRVLATRRSAAARQKDAAGVSEVFPTRDLLEMLPECDFVIAAVPLTLETRGMIGEAELKAMKPTAYLINVARGPIVDQEALVQALKQGWIAGAGLDVFATEPLPPDSELWQLPNVIVSPHLAGISEHESTAVTELFRENARRFVNDEPLINLIDKERGY